MNRRRLGCLTGGGLLGAALTLALLLAFYVARGGAMFSPGALNAQRGETVLNQVTSHADTGGNCAACHPAPWSTATLADRCLACHTGVADELAGNDGLHALLRGSATAFDCRGCHSEHRGASAALTDVRPDTFPHDATGYSLTGHRATQAGAAFACGDCHTKSIAEFNAGTCDDCHRQIDAAYMETHAADFGVACLNCHDGVDRYSRKTFDHGALAFPLQGRHAQVTCGKCHFGAKTVADLKTAPAACVDCHRKDDKHRGQFGGDCAACHNAAAWQDAKIDHAKTAFPLTGKHVDVKCDACHKNGIFKGTPQNCVDCHRKDDKHQGQFGGDCAACHNAADWQDAKIDHAKTAFPLTGKHVDVKCDACHRNGVFKGTPQGCVDCHSDPEFHRGAFGSRCIQCHTADGWQPAAFTAAHTFPLDHGEGGRASCRTCHPQTVTTYTCYGCHEHTQAETIAKHREEVSGDITDCVRCHPTGQEKEGEGRGEGRHDD